MNSCVLRLLLTWMPNNAKNISRKVGKKLRRPAVHAFIKHCGTKSARIAPSKTLKDLNIQFLPKTQLYFNFRTRTLKSQPYIFTIPKYTVSIHWCVVYAILKLCWTSPCFFLNCWTKHQQSHIAELYPILTHCLGIPNLIIILRSTVIHYMAELYPILTHCWGIANINTLLSYNLS